jgi:hypothetical protein
MILRSRKLLFSFSHSKSEVLPDVSRMKSFPAPLMIISLLVIEIQEHGCTYNPHVQPFHLLTHFVGAKLLFSSLVQVKLSWRDIWCLFDMERGL